jgi:transmembrane sensor
MRGKKTMGGCDMEKIIPFPDRTAIEAEACAWIARLDGDQPSVEELAAFHEWLSRSPQHREEIKRLTTLWADLNVLTELAVPLEKPRFFLWRSFRASVAGYLNSGFPKGRFAAFASAAALMLFAIFFFYPKPEALQETKLVYATVLGERKPVALSDGSSVVLNTDSRIEVDYSPNQRKIRLLKGEAYFKVAHNANRPFQV